MTEQQEMPTLEGLLTSLPATILQLLNIESPSHIPPPIQPILDIFGSRGVDRIVIEEIDNFGLFEITYYKPEFLISTANALCLLSTNNPYTLGVFHQMMFGGFEYEPNGFHLLKHIQAQGKSSVFVGRERDIKRYDGGTPSIAKTNDMSVWIEAAKVINRHQLSWLHWLDFEELYRSKKRTGASNPEELIQKLIKRTDKWILANYKQLRSKSLMIIIGNHGRYKIDLNYQGKVAEWRKASVPLALFLYKE
jgi:hypothetical protein